MIKSRSVRQAARLTQLRPLRVSRATNIRGLTALSFGALLSGVFFWAVLFGAVFFGPSGAAAQYTVLGGGAGTGAPDEEALRKNVEAAPWKAGPFRIQPWFGLRDVSYVRQQQSVSGTEANDQVTITLGAGIRAYAPVGGKVIWAAQILPEYVWWQDDTTKDGLNGRYGMGLFGYANRLQFQLSHRLEEQQTFFSEEIQELTTTSTNTTRAGVELKLARGIHFFGAWDRVEFEGDGDDSVLFTLLDRTENSLSAGVRLKSHRGWSVGLGVRSTEGDFEPGARDYSFESEGVTLDLGATTGRFSVFLNLEDAEIEPQPGSVLEPIQRTLGNLDVGLKVARRLSLEGYALRQRTFSVAETRSLIVRDEQGVRADVGLGAFDLRLLAGQGSLESEGVSDAPSQTDDYDLYGATLSFRARKLGVLQVNVIHRAYDEGLFGEDREVTSYGLSIQLGELAQRLSVGESGSTW